jgi:urea transport system permease protein
VALLRLIALLLALAAVLAPPARAAEDDLRKLVDALAVGADFGKFKETGAAVEALAATGAPQVAPILKALGDGSLYARKSDKAVVIVREAGDRKIASDPLTGKEIGEVDPSAMKRIRVNNALRETIQTATGRLTLGAKDPAVRRKAANDIFQSPNPSSIAALDAAIEAETDPGVRTLYEQARAASVLAAGARQSDAALLAAIPVLAARGDQASLSYLGAVANGAAGPVKDAAAKAVRDIKSELAMWSAAQNVWYGLSLGSVLLLAAIGLAITFGVMGVINMAHGEMVMLGAYTTFVVQQAMASWTPALAEYSLALAVPLAFLVAGAVGVAIERGVIRFLYGRPLETLLATWGLSLILQQAVRSIFGPTNRDVTTPDWLAGAFQLGHLTITYSRMWIIVFALAVFALLTLVLRKTSFGLHLRAVTQNRAMAGSTGIRTPWVDALTFGLGSGIAGIAGVALSQIDNVSPNLGQGYIIDSFMVVVFGGVGNLWGTLVGATVLGIVNKFLEPYAGAVLGKILVLVAIILFIQKRPRGLFALRGRAVES